MLSIAADLPDIPYETLCAPAVLPFADDALRRARLRSLIDAAGGRLVADGTIEVAAARIDRQAGPCGVVLDLREDGGVALDGLLARLDAVRTRGVVIAPRGLIDIVSARITDPALAILVDPEDAEIVVALSDLLAPTIEMLSESSGEANGRRLVQLSEEVGRIARRLAQLSNGNGEGEASPPLLIVPAPMSAIVERAPQAAPDTTMARTLLRLRRLRDRHFEPALFADPAWDMLLDLMAADHERRRVAVSSLCIAAMVPPTTALRWIAAMTEQGLFARRPDPDDGRRVFIALTDLARAAMERYLAAARHALAAV
jgi:DNA-binding MarR family transcriptional regulator